ncbi:response regulator [Salibacteraceae bacterium]|nr:response regulator [Salibacteraceae bacterium]MDB4104456.1 response regulator [Salibacteraceae bacterium]MDB9708713.1 response regulator [Salibacteraceae bacterium]MDC1304989.1 response regulator [Salibacteraceae bacterium]
MNILVVEDESIVAKDIQVCLRKLGYDVIGVVSSGEEAVEKAEEFDLDLIMMDIMLKGEMSGIEAAEIIRKKKSIPVIFLTAYTDRNTVDKAKETEPFGYIIKPFKEIDIQTAIEIALYKHSREMVVKKERDMYYSMVEKQDSVDMMFVKANQRLVKIKYSEIYFIEALKDYVVINTLERRYTIHSTMKDIESKMPEKDFIRVHRSFIVRIDKIKEIDHSNVVLENDKKTVPVGGSYKDLLQQRINMI